MSQSALNEEQFGDFKLYYARPDMAIPRHRIVATAIHPQHGEMHVGEMNWHPKSHEITGVHVHPEHQRQGLATAMWRMGQEQRPRPVHSADRTKAGEAWARSVGGRLPRRKAVYDPVTRSEV